MKETRFKQTEIGLVPEEWKVVRLGEICSLKRGVRVTRSILTGNGKYPVFQNTSLPLGFYHTYNVLANTPFIIVGGSAGQVGICSSNYWAADDCVSINSTGKTNNFFLYYSLLFLQRLINSNVRNASVPRLDQTTIKNLEILLPPLAEQSRIAGALSSVDGLLSSLSRLIEKKRALRTAAMQQLLTAKTRLPGFDEPWKEVRLGEVGIKIQKGCVLQAKNFVSGNIRVIAGGKTEAGFHNAANYYGETITISASGANAGYVWLHNEPIFATDCSVITPSDCYDLSFVYYVLSSKQSDIYKLQTGGAQPHVHPNSIKEILISFPSLPEQRAIAAVLSSMDSELAALEAKRSKVEGLRTGMMQQLLSGRIRLTEEAAERKQKTKPLE